ncbi:MAG TPA: VOC family protein [Thermoanaerobaculia bacterium]|nr:VOC family protein [Thermoanaerobaculia bacterium]
MINGVHALLYVKDAERVREFFRDVLGFSSVDAGHGWLIFALPPAELGIHPTEDGGHQALYLLCDDVKAAVRELESKGVQIARAIHEESWGLVTALALPGGGEIGLYQPKHPTALHLPR